VDMMAFKPRGNPLAPQAQPDPRDGVTVRLRDLAARRGATAATVRLFTGVAAAAVTDLLEHDDGAQLPGHEGAVTALVPARGAVTLAIRPDRIIATAGDQDPGLAVTGAPPEPAQPVFTRYWLHGKGPAPAGNLPVSVHLSPARIAVQAGRSATARLTVACGPAPASGTVTLDVPDEIRLAPAARADQSASDLEVGESETGKLHYHLAAGGYAAWDLVLDVPEGITPARRFLAARILDEAGQVLEDAVVIAIGEAERPGTGMPLDELLPALESLGRAEAAEAELTMLSGHLDLPPGGRGEVTVSISNATASELRGEAQLLSPHGSWAACGRWVTDFSVEPGSSATLTFPVAVARDARPGQQWWALAKVMYFGRLRYSEPIWINVVR